MIRIQRLLGSLGFAVLLLLAPPCFAEPATNKTANKTTAAKEMEKAKKPVAENSTKTKATADSKGKGKDMIEMKTSMGTIKIALNSELAPLSTKNFKAYADAKFYDGTVFHRVIKGFMVQGGGFDLGKTELKKKDTKDPIKNEAKNGLKNERGTIAMARTQDPHSATAQFYINHKDNPNLDYPSFDGWGYAVFGKVTEGLDVVDKIAAVSTGEFAGFKDVPKEAVKIISVKVLN